MKTNSPKLGLLITDFIEYLEIERGLSPTTSLKYDYRLSRFLGWAQKRLDRSQITLDDLNLPLIRKFRVYLSREGMKSSTQYNFMVTMRSFLKFLSKHDYQSIAPDKIELNKYNPSRSIKFLNQDQLIKLMEAPDISTITGLRDRAILELLFSTGLRVSELARLNKDQIDFKNREFSIVGKGGFRRIVFLSDDAVEWLKSYLKKRSDKYKPLFLHYSGPKNMVDGVDVAELGSIEALKRSRSKKGSKSDESNLDDTKYISKLDFDEELAQNSKSQIEDDLSDIDGERFRLSVRSVQRLVKKYARLSGIPVDATPHTMRHSFATDLLGAGADLRMVQESLGHKNVATTQIYTHITNTQLKKAHQEFHGKWRKDEESESLLTNKLSSEISEDKK